MPENPNILFISIDDLRPELGCYGNEHIISPNIDRLADKGTMFTNHFVSVPTCGASRYSLLTGMLPRSRGDLSNEAIRNNLGGKPEADTPESFIHHLRRNGYTTVGIGKTPDGADLQSAPLSCGSAIRLKVLRQYYLNQNHILPVRVR